MFLTDIMEAPSLNPSQENDCSEVYLDIRQPLQARYTVVHEVNHQKFYRQYADLTSITSVPEDGDGYGFRKSCYELQTSMIDPLRRGYLIKKKYSKT